MKTIIIGAGELGLNIARHLVLENQNVTLIDSDPEKLRAVNEMLDVQTILGMGSHPDVLEAAGCGSADMIIAVTRSDEVNMVACQMAYSLFNVPKKIARVRHSSYRELVTGHLFTPDNMPVDVIISPEIEVADALFQNISIAGAFDTTQFAQGEINLVGLHVREGSSFVNIPIQELTQGDAPTFALMAIFRKERIIVPRGHDHVEVGDEIYFACQSEDTEAVMSFMGFEKSLRPKRAFIIGGGRIGERIATRLETTGVSTKILEIDWDRANTLAETMKGALVIHGDAINKDLLIQENISDMDLVLAVTSNDATNALVSVMARQLGAKHIVTRINQMNYMPLVEGLDLEKVISPLEVTASRILQHVRRGTILSLHAIHEGKAQVLEAQVNKSSDILGRRIADVDLPVGVNIGAIYSEEEGVVIPEADTILSRGDRIILFSTTEKITEVEGLF